MNAQSISTKRGQSRRAQPGRELHDRLRINLRERRLATGITQAQLARRAGISRQTVSGIEGGQYGPSVEVALRLAAALACSVEDLFSVGALAEGIPLLEADGDAPTDLRVAVAHVNGRTIARPLRGLGADSWETTAAGGLAHVASGRAPAAESPARRVAAPPTAPHRKTVAGSTAPRALVDRWAGHGPALLLAGCDPALGLLGQHAARGLPQLAAHWWEAGNAAALAQLGRGSVHAIALHLSAGAASPAPPIPVRRFQLADWQLGWIVAPSNPQAIQGASDLARPGLRLANREPGSGARTVLDSLLETLAAEARLAPAAIAGYDRIFRGHREVADAVRWGLADMGLGIAVAAERQGLGFVPVEDHTCELWVAEASLQEDAVKALLEAAASTAFQRELAAFGPYDTERTGLAL